jgi:D-alanyl-D-alanine carboxypeptidase
MRKIPAKAQSVLIALSVAAAAAAQPANRPQQVLDAARTARGAPGASAAIMSGGAFVWQGSSGQAVIETGAPVTGSTLYSLASVTKTFTSTMILRLYQEGRIGLGGFIEPYVPARMPSTGEVTVRDLLGMTSGYRDVEGFPTILKWLRDPNHLWKRAQILRRVRPVFFQPGTRYQYSNTNYVILGGIVDRLSPRRIGGEFQRLIVQPVGLAGEAFFERDPRAAGRIAHGYN